MFLINVNLTNNDIIPPIDKINDIDNKLIYCDLSGLSLTNYDFSLNLTPSVDNSNSPNSVLKCNILFRNNGFNPKITTLIINNIPTTNLFINNRDTSSSQMTNQEFIITYDAGNGSYTSISTIRKYN